MNNYNAFNDIKAANASYTGDFTSPFQQIGGYSPDSTTDQRYYTTTGDGTWQNPNPWHTGTTADPDWLYKQKDYYCPPLKKYPIYVPNDPLVDPWTQPHIDDDYVDPIPPWQHDNWNPFKPVQTEPEDTEEERKRKAEEFNRVLREIQRQQEEAARQAEERRREAELAKAKAIIAAEEARKAEEAAKKAEQEAKGTRRLDLEL